MFLCAGRPRSQRRALTVKGQDRIRHAEHIYTVNDWLFCILLSPHTLLLRLKTSTSVSLAGVISTLCVITPRDRLPASAGRVTMATASPALQVSLPGCLHFLTSECNITQSVQWSCCIRSANIQPLLPLMQDDLGKSVKAAETLLIVV